MAIRVVCPSCGRRGKVPDAARGAAIRCPACGVSSPFGSLSPVDLPEPAPVPLVEPPPWQSKRGVEDSGLVVVPPPRAASGPLHIALGICGLVMLGMLGIIIDLTRDRDRTPDGSSVASVAEEPRPADPAPAFLPGEPLGGPGGGGPEGIAPVAGEAIEPDRADADRPAPVPAAPVQPPAEVAPVDLPGRALSTAEIVERCEPSVALIEGAMSSGTGFLVGPGLLATNAHVIESELIASLQVRFPSAPGGQAGPMPAELLFEDRERDLALLRVPSSLPPLVVAAEHRYIKGEDVTVIGNPGVGGELILENAISKGVMSSRAVIDGQEYIQLGIAINPGNSGGPVFDARGEVIGVATLKTAEEEALGFCIPVADLNRALDRVRHQGEVDARLAAARHRPGALFHLLVTAGAIHAVGLDRHVIAWNDARGGSIRQLIAADPELAKLREGLDAFHSTVEEPLEDEGRRLRLDPDVPDDVKDGVTRLAASYAQFRQILSRPPDDFGTLLRRVSSAESTHLDLTRALGRRLDIEVDENLLAALAPLQVESSGGGRALQDIPNSFPEVPPGFGSFRERFGVPNIPRSPRMSPHGQFVPNFP
ncbi:trypsin-like peptidase domain-containing protein [Tautonia sociabilis]|uniref:Trypsin-like serine protease n=1 Tax=Tautonia sociabilis TaxID=2080755 RepID=A0A432MKW9_9BACT|nr:trypsin-like peptidase domain-containing protein [Tautonia sociabilis]RUL87785.1 trypsin-like serine protease [Tautonia sociabilis]